MQQGQHTSGIQVYESASAIVRVHPGKMTDEQSKAAYEAAMVRLYKAISKKGARK